MPIYGLTATRGRIPRLGELRKGGPKGSGHGGRGKDLNYFRFTAQDEPELEAEFHARFGAEPRKIECFLPYEHPDENFDAWKFIFTKHSFEIKCNGRNICAKRQPDGTLMHYDTSDPATAPPCLAPTKRCYTDHKGVPHVCEPRALLHIIIPGLMRYGVTSVITGSKIDIANISGTLIQLHQMAKRYGMTLPEIPMQVTRHVQQVSSPMPDGSRRRVPKSLLRLEVLPAWINQRMIAVSTHGEILPMGQDDEISNALGQPIGQDAYALEQEVSSKMLPERTHAPVPARTEQGPAAPVGQTQPAQVIEPAADATAAALELVEDAVSKAGFSSGEGARHKWTLVSLILNRPVPDYAGLHVSDLETVLYGIQNMQSVFPNMQAAIKFVSDIKDEFLAGLRQMDTWDWGNALSEWKLKGQNPPEPPVAPSAAPAGPVTVPETESQAQQAAADEPDDLGYDPDEDLPF